MANVVKLSGQMIRMAIAEGIIGGRGIDGNIVTSADVHICLLPARGLFPPGRSNQYDSRKLIIAIPPREEHNRARYPACIVGNSSVIASILA